MIEQYMIVARADYYDFVNSVQSALAAGWQLQGGVSIIQVGIGAYYPYFHQAMVK